MVEIYQPTQASRGWAGSDYSQSSHEEQMKAVGAGCLLQTGLSYFQFTLGFWLQKETLD